MQLIIELCESDLIKIVEGTIKSLLRYNVDSYTYTQGELTAYVQQQTKIALMRQIDQVDLKSHVADIFKTYFEEIVQDTVRKEIERIVKNTIKEMKTKGELLT